MVTIPFGSSSLELEVDPKVGNPEIMNSGIQVVQFLAEHSDIVKDKTVNDMGTGCGIIGIAACLSGAEKVFMEDIDLHAVANARRNVQRLNLEKKSEVFVSDLFDSYGERPKVQVQIFNHPFFSAEPIPGKEWTRMMLGGTELIDRYLDEAPRYSTLDAIYIMPWFVLAENKDGTLDNDPAKRAPQHGYEIADVVEQAPVLQGVQQAPFKIYLLRKK